MDQKVMEQMKALEKTLKECPDYQDFHRRREEVFSDPTNAALINEFKRLRFRAQTAMASGNPVNEEEQERQEKIFALLQMNPDVYAFFLSEVRLQATFAEIYKMLGDLCGLDMDVMLD